MNSRQLMASLARKTLVFIAMMFLLSLIVFYVSRLTPGDPLQSFYGDAMQSMTTTELDAARERLGLNGPIWMQYAKWIGNVMQGDFGISLKYKRPVLDVVSPLIGNTLMLGGIAYALVFMLAIALALFCARFEDTFMDRFVCRIGTVAFYVPAFWMGVVLVLVFSVNLKLLPSSGAYGIGKSGDMADRLRHLVLPGQMENTKRVIDYVSTHFPPKTVLFSLMSQYTPQPGSTGALARRLNEREYRTAVQYMRDCGLTDGFCQELSSAKEEYTPVFDLQGV